MDWELHNDSMMKADTRLPCSWPEPVRNVVAGQLVIFISPLSRLSSYLMDFMYWLSIDTLMTTHCVFLRCLHRRNLKMSCELQLLFTAHCL